jgi:hypothetical protein
MRSKMKFDSVVSPSLHHHQALQTKVQNADVRSLLCPRNMLLLAVIGL